MIEDTIQKAHAICGKRWYVVDNIMEILHFPNMDLIENACPPKLMIEQVEHQCDKAKEKIQGLDHISIEDVDQLVRHPFAVEGKFHIFIRIWHKLSKNEIENFKCDAQLGFEIENYPNINELLDIWARWQEFVDYQFLMDIPIPISWGFIPL